MEETQIYNLSHNIHTQRYDLLKLNSISPHETTLFFRPITSVIVHDNYDIMGQPISYYYYDMLILHTIEQLCLFNIAFVFNV